MSQTRSNPSAAFVEEYDEASEEVVPDSRRTATVSTNPDFQGLRTSIEYTNTNGSNPSDARRVRLVDDAYHVPAPSSPNPTRRRSRIPFNLTQAIQPPAEPFDNEDWAYLRAPSSGYIHDSATLFQGLDQLRSLRSSSPTGATVAARDPVTASYQGSQRSRSASSDGDSLTYLQSPLPRTSELPEPSHHGIPAHNAYYPAYNPAPYRYAAPGPPAPAPHWGSPYSLGYYRPPLVPPNYVTYPGTGMSAPEQGRVPPLTDSVRVQPIETNQAPRKVGRCSEKPVHRYISLRRLQPERDAEDLGNSRKPWRAFTRELPLNLPGKPELHLERYNVIRSRLISGVSSERDHAAVLTYDEAEGERPFETCWIHYTSDTMELEAFKTEVLRLKEVPEDAVPILINLFRELRQVYERPFVHGRYLEPIVRRFAAGDRDEDEGEQEAKYSVEIVFIAFPYISLEQLRPPPSVDRQSVHPVRSLLQFHYSFVSTTSRDKNQVALHAGNQPDGLYVPQVWMLLINDDLIVSTGPVDIDTLRGSYIYLEKTGPATSPSVKRQLILVGMQNQQYCFPLSECNTWFEFIKAFVGVLEPGSPMAAEFLQDTWRNSFELLVGDEPISEVNWSETIHKTVHGDITIRLVQKPSSQHVPLTESGTHRPIPSLENQLMIYSNGHLGVNGTHHHSSPAKPIYYSIPPAYYASQYTPFQSPTWPRMPPSYPSGNDTQALVHRPARTGQPTQQPSREHLDRLNDRNRKRSPQSIRITDLSGVELQIPWRIGQSWTNMYPVVAIKMQFTAEHRHAFITDNYVLDTPGGPITSTDWDMKVYPGISVTIRLKDRAQDEQHKDTASRLDREYGSMRALHGAETDDRDSAGSDAGRMSTPDVQSTGHISPHENHMAKVEAVNVFDYLVPEEGDATQLLAEGCPDIMNPFRYQVPNDAWKTTENLVPPSSSSSSIFSTPAQSLSLSPTTSPATPPQSVLVNPHKPRALFEWRIDWSTDRGPTGMESDEKSDHSDVSALLEGCDKEAFHILASHPAQSTVMKNIPKATLMHVQAEIERTKIGLLHLPNDSHSHYASEAWKGKEKVIEAALHLLDVFVPLHYPMLDDSWLVGKYFGAIQILVRGSYAASYLDHIASILSYLGKAVDRIHAGAAYDSKERSRGPVLPPALVHAFSPLVFLVCICSQLCDTQSQGWHSLQTWTERAYDRLTHGRYELINMARTGQHSEAKVFTKVGAGDIIILIIKRLAELPRANVPWQQKSRDGFNLLEMYRSHISQMEFRARRTPSSDLFDEIQQLMEEIQILHLVLDQQLTILESTREVTSSPNDVPTKIGLSVISQTQQHLRQMQHDLLQLETMAEKAAAGLRYMLEVRKESNSKAITIFTIVTVIFLPLSFVSSYLGMNSVDIRAGTFTQGVFWATAVPITACLVAILWVTLRFRRRVRRFFVDRLSGWWR